MKTKNTIATNGPSMNEQININDESQHDDDSTSSAFWTILYDVATNTAVTRIVRANCNEDALEVAVRIVNRENDYLPEDDGGFRPLMAYSAEDLLAIIDYCRKGRVEP